MATKQFYSLRVRDVRRETDSCISVALDIPSEDRADFQFQAGQYITFKQTINGEELRRSYSLCSAPHEGEWRVAIKAVEGGRFSGWANTALKVGDVLDTMPPMGNFLFTPEASASRHIVAFAAGSGITPILSIMKTVLEEEPNSRFTLIYGNQRVSSIIFKEEIDALKNKFTQRLQVIHILSREKLETDLHCGRICCEKCDQLFGSLLSLSEVDQYFMCGPEAMILEVKDWLGSKGVSAEKVKFELFSSDSAKQQKEAYKKEHAADAEKMSRVTIKVDDRSMEFDLAFGGETILDAALKQGADLPFACKGGVCCTCRAKVVEGTVNMELNYALEADEVEQGFVLTCQAHPTSDHVVIDFDAR